jgi:(2Fe-2S) ferredoxin
MATLSEVASNLFIGEYHRHVILCAGDKCCSAAEGEAAWAELKKQLKERDLSLSAGPNACFRTRAGCLRVCQDGPIAVVYPEGTWYARLAKDRIPLFVQQHLVEGQPVEEWIFARNALPKEGDQTQFG